MCSVHNLVSNWLMRYWDRKRKHPSSMYIRLWTAYFLACYFGCSAFSGTVPSSLALTKPSLLIYQIALWFLLTYYGVEWSVQSIENWVKTFLISLVVAAIPLIALLVSTPTLLPWESISIPYLPTFHVIATMAPWVGSIMYHMFMNHCSGYPVYKAVLTIDVLGI